MSFLLWKELADYQTFQTLKITHFYFYVYDIVNSDFKILQFIALFSISAVEL